MPSARASEQTGQRKNLSISQRSAKTRPALRSRPYSRALSSDASDGGLNSPPACERLHRAVAGPGRNQRADRCAAVKREIQRSLRPLEALFLRKPRGPNQDEHTQVDCVRTQERQRHCGTDPTSFACSIARGFPDAPSPVPSRLPVGPKASREIQGSAGQSVRGEIRRSCAKSDPQAAQSSGYSAGGIALGSKKLPAL